MLVPDLWDPTMKIGLAGIASTVLTKMFIG
jgi:hypothetical protein